MTGTIEIIDAQVHLNQLTPDWRTAPLDAVLASGIQAMDAVGIDRVLIGEARGFDPKLRQQGQELPNGAIRSDYPFSERAVELYPDRFIYHVRIDFRDPELERLAEEVGHRPGARGMRIVPVPQTGDVDSLQRGEFEPLFAAAERHRVPVFAWVPGRAQLLVPYIRKFPRLQFIIDHCGVGVAPIRIGELPVTMATSLTASLRERFVQLERVCELAQYPNVALKWCHAPGLLSAEEYPYRDLLPLLRKALEAFGPERIMWASDYTVARDQNGNSWAQCLYYLLDSDELSWTEKEWLLGGAVRKALDWARS
ncbi:MAG: amidohydrolase [Chloroflexi bacterium]|nr:amidohydrolase [Chloroflexota bacterium]MBV9598314.1 amidohydrolase [Chloroflexota bacterium]